VRSEMQIGRKMFGAALSVVLVLTPLPTVAFPQQPSNQNQALLEATARAYAEAEIKSYVERYVNSHPPIEGVQGFGSKALFAAQLLLAANDYVNADTDKKKFRAVEEGAAAYVAYAYAATPAVGLIVTAVVLTNQIIEGAVASSYEEAMLAIYKDMLQTQFRINDLKVRLGIGEALRFMAFVDETQRVLGRAIEIDNQIRTDCGTPASTFESLGTCLTDLIQAVNTRAEAIIAIDRLLDCPDSMIAFLPLAQGKSSEAGSADSVAASRKRLSDIRQQTAAQHAELTNVYEKFVQDYQRLAVNVIFEDALADPQRQELVTEIKYQCLIDQTILSSSAATIVYEITSERQQLSTGKSTSQDRDRLGSAVSALLESYEQRRIACPPIMQDEDLSRLMLLVRSRIKQLPRP
jgi:hypothetical protein